MGLVSADTARLRLVAVTNTYSRRRARAVCRARRIWLAGVDAGRPGCLVLVDACLELPARRVEPDPAADACRIAARRRRPARA